MESSIAEFVERQLACELLPTESRQDQALKLVKCFGHLKRVGSERVLRTNKRNFGFAGSSKLAMQWCAYSKHIRVRPWFACSRHRVARS